MHGDQDDLIQPNKAERLNGWTAETLTRYVREQEKKPPPSQFFSEKPALMVESATHYNPWEW